MTRFARFVLLSALTSSFTAALVSGCSEDPPGSTGSTLSTSSATTTSGSASTGTGGAGGAGSGGATSSASSGGGGTPLPTTTSPCQGKIYECGDLLDNDMDGLLDSQDPDCLGACDNSENSFYGNIPGQDGPGCVIDCYFDQDSGAGNDGCYWNHTCDPNSVPPNYYPEPEQGTKCTYDMNANTPGTNKSCAELNLEQDKVCHDYCGPLTPNGCDCFGCCELPPGKGTFVFLGSKDAMTGLPSCSLKDLADPDKCHPCKPVDACLNGCGVCELCVGKDTLPPECFPDGGGMGGAGGGGSMQCPEGITPCGVPGQAPCPPNYYCITGCCQATPG
jgi:hypothetical protein